MASDDYERFVEHFPEGGDLTLQLLKGHLLVETALRETFEMQLYHPKALSGERGTQLTCHQIICLTEAITPLSQNMPWVWTAVRKLNSIRNDLAHQLSPKDLQRKADALASYVESHGPDARSIMAKLGIAVPEGSRLLLVFISLCTCLSALKTALRDGS